MRVLILALLSLFPAACRSPAETPPDVPVGPDVGYRAPPLQGVLLDGTTYTLDVRSSGTRVVVFYRSAECGLCRVQLQQIQEHLPNYQRQGGQVIGVTMDPPELSRQLLAGMPLDFAIVSVDAAVFDDWNVLSPDSRVPLPATYIVDRDGIIQYRHIGRNASDRMTDADILTVLGRLDAL